MRPPLTAVVCGDNLCCQVATVTAPFYGPLTYDNLFLVVVHLVLLIGVWIYLYVAYRRVWRKSHYIVLTSATDAESDGYNSPNDAHASLNGGSGGTRAVPFMDRNDGSHSGALSRVHMVFLSAYLCVCVASFLSLLLPGSPVSRVVQMLLYQSKWPFPFFLLSLMFWRDWKSARALTFSVFTALVGFAVPTTLSFAISAALASSVGPPRIDVPNCTNCQLYFFDELTIVGTLLHLLAWLLGVVVAVRQRRLRVLCAYMLLWSVARLVPSGLLLFDAHLSSGVCGLAVVELLHVLLMPFVLLVALERDSAHAVPPSDDPYVATAAAASAANAAARRGLQKSDANAATQTRAVAGEGEGERRPLLAGGSAQSARAPSSPAATAAHASPTVRTASPKPRVLSEQEQIAKYLLDNLDKSVTVVDFKDVARERKIGAGGFGEVFVGKLNGEVVAIKRVLDMDQKKVRTFLREINVMAILDHPNVLRLIGVAIAVNDSYLLTEYMERGSLFDIIHDKKRRRDRQHITWANAVKILRETADGMAYLHGLNPPFIHRDLKSQNILIADQWQVKICDFGMARVRSLGITMTKLGTLQWVAPEVLRDERYSEKADIYSYAILVWELVARKVPYVGQNSLVVARAVAFNHLRPEVSAETTPGPLAELMERCWHKTPDERPSFPEIIDFIDANIQDVSGWPPAPE